MITREQLTGAIKLVNAAKVYPRLDAIRKLLEAEHTPDEVNKVLADLESYAPWTLGLEAEKNANTPNPAN